MNRCRPNTQGGGVFVILLDEVVSQFFDGDALLIRAADHLIVDVREVLHECDFETAVFKVTAQDVKNNERTGIADMEIVIYSRSAGIHADLAFMQRFKLFFFAGCAVIQFHCFYPPFLYRVDCSLILTTVSPVCRVQPAGP